MSCNESAAKIYNKYLINVFLFLFCFIFAIHFRPENVLVRLKNTKWKKNILNL